MKNRKNVLHIDGEYLEKGNLEAESLRMSLKMILGEVGYPTHLVYYGAHKVSETTISKLSKLNIPNLEINTEGYITTLSDGRRTQKGVDTTIVINVSQDQSDFIYLLSGDGDMFPLAKAFYKTRNKKLITLSFKKSTTEKLKKYSDNFYLDPEENSAIEDEGLLKIENIIFEAWYQECKGDYSKYLTASRLGQLGSQKNQFKITSIKKNFIELGKKDYIDIKPAEDPKDPDTLIRFTNVPSAKGVQKQNLLKGTGKTDTANSTEVICND